MSGYSQTPLAQKLGFKEGHEVCLIGAPEGYLELVEPLPNRVQFTSMITPSTDMVHVFSVVRAELEDILRSVREEMKPTAVVWVSWPKRSSKAPTDITEDVVREVALPMGFVDVKVCAVDEMWSALKVVVRKELR